MTELWIGVVEVKPLANAPDRLDGDAGAFVNIVTWASDTPSYLHKAETIVAHLGGLFVADLVRAEPVRVRRDQIGGFNDEIEDMIERAEENPNAIIFGTFHHYLNDDA